MIAPTGTIGFMMDCDTTGIEPDLALVKYKKLVGGGVIKIVNNTVPQALIKLGYSPEQVEQIVATSIRPAPSKALRTSSPSILPVFDCSFRPQNGTRSIHYMGHVRMMAAVQPFISGAISKTINMPEECTVEEIMDAYIESWRLGLKAVAIYRDNSKRVQPLSSGSGKGEKKAGVDRGRAAAAAAPWRRSSTGRCGASCRMSGAPSRTSSRSAATKATSPSGMYEDGTPGRDLHHHGEGRLDDLGPDGQLRDGGQLQPAVRRAAEVLRGQVQPRAFRAERLDGQSAGAVCEVDHGLHLPLAGREVPRDRSMR